MRFSFLQIRGNAIENKEIIPSISYIRQELPSLVEHAKQRGISLAIDQGPMCALDKNHEVFEVAEHTSKGNRKLEDLLIKPAKCEPCKMYGVCRGYVKMFGPAELRPFKRKNSCSEEIN